MDINQIPPELLMELLNSGQDIGGAQDKMAQQQALAQRLRGMSGTPKGMSVNNGRTFVAANPLEHLAGVGNSFMANKADQAAMGAQSQIRGLQGGQNKRILDALMKMGAKTPSATAYDMETDPSQMFMGQ